MTFLKAIEMIQIHLKLKCKIRKLRYENCCHTLNLLKNHNWFMGNEMCRQICLVCQAPQQLMRNSIVYVVFERALSFHEYDFANWMGCFHI